MGSPVTQIIPNYIGGVSTQPDERKLPGQVVEASDVFIDATFGLTKRQGAQYLTTLENLFVLKIENAENYEQGKVDGIAIM